MVPRESKFGRGQVRENSRSRRIAQGDLGGSRLGQGSEQSGGEQGPGPLGQETSDTRVRIFRWEHPTSPLAGGWGPKHALKKEGEEEEREHISRTGWEDEGTAHSDSPCDSVTDLEIHPIVERLLPAHSACSEGVGRQGGLLVEVTPACGTTEATHLIRKTRGSFAFLQGVPNSKTLKIIKEAFGRFPSSFISGPIFEHLRCLTRGLEN